MQVGLPEVEDDKNGSSILSKLYGPRSQEPIQPWTFCVDADMTDSAQDSPGLCLTTDAQVSPFNQVQTSNPPESRAPAAKDLTCLQKDGAIPNDRAFRLQICLIHGSLPVNQFQRCRSLFQPATDLNQVVYQPGGFSCRSLSRRIEAAVVDTRPPSSKHHFLDPWEQWEQPMPFQNLLEGDLPDVLHN